MNQHEASETILLAVDLLQINFCMWAWSEEMVIPPGPSQMVGFAVGSYKGLVGTELLCAHGFTAQSGAARTGLQGCPQLGWRIIPDPPGAWWPSPCCPAALPLGGYWVACMAGSWPWHPVEHRVAAGWWAMICHHKLPGWWQTSRSSMELTMVNRCSQCLAMICYD